jgi:predicted Rdx family selenoprotein
MEKEDFEDGSIYYYSPLSFIYCLSRAYADGGAIGLKLILRNIKNYLLNKQNVKGEWGNTLENAMATVSLINCGYKGIVVDGAINNLLKEQKADGGWPNSAFFAGVPELFYGSRELTTAIAIEALWKYLKVRKNEY